MIEEFTDRPVIAYFSMEIGLRSDIPTYSGGLGVLAGDTIRSAADMRVPMVGITLISRKGYFRQDIDEEGNQIEIPDVWDPSTHLMRLSQRVSVGIEGRSVLIGAWLYVHESVTGGRVPIIFLDTDIEGNTPEDRTLTDYLYGGDQEYRLKQEIVLGIGGVRMLEELGFEVRKYHMNEGHSSLLTIELLSRHRRDIEEVWDEKLVWDAEAVRRQCVFTTHTPVEAGHDKFPYDLVKRVYTDTVPLEVIKEYGGGEHLNMTLLGLNLSHFINGVAKRHQEVSMQMFPGYEIHAITNGVHPFTWTHPRLRELYDRYLPGWANEPEIFVRAGKIPKEALWQAHSEAKRELLEYVKETTGIELGPDILTIGFARRATAYKRADLIFTDIQKLLQICEGRVQFIFAGKAHPRDLQGKELIRRIHQLMRELDPRIKIAYLKNYNMDLALKIVSGVDVWLNTPQRPYEASGTSGMKAALNGVINFSVLDGWWIEGHEEGVTGWAIGGPPEEPSDPQREADDLYRKLEEIIIPMYYNHREDWIRIMRNSIRLLAYYFNSHRMMRRYVTEAYILY